MASLLELAGWPKPGNVHRTKNFEKTRFEHFLAGIIAIYPDCREFCERIFQLSFENGNDYKLVELGRFFISAAKNMIKWQKGGNVILGHILILGPLIAASTICLKTGKNSFKDFKNYLNKIINESTVVDTENLFKAIRLSKPGGLGKIEKYDITDNNSIDEINTDKITLKKIFDLSKEYDLISQEYSTGFYIILEEGLPYFLNSFNIYKDINIATVNTFLFLLSKHNDTLIIRKSGREAAISTSKSAAQILEYGGITSEEGLKLTLEFDKKLQESKGDLNPGTIADLISGVIFTALIFGVRF